MKFSIWKEGVVSDTVFFRLKDGEKRVYLVACDERGNTLPKGHILAISKTTGKLRLCPDQNRNIGLAVGENGKIILEN